MPAVKLATPKIDEAVIRIEGPFAFSIEVPNADDTGTVYFLQCDGGEWRMDNLWIAQGKVDRFDVLARALRKIAEQN